MNFRVEFSGDGVGRLLLLGMGCLLAGCASLRRETAAPVFESRIPEPVGIRMIDKRPEVQKGNQRDPDWIYFRAAGSEQSGLLASYLGKALTAMNASPGYRVLPVDSGNGVAPVVIEIEYLKGYARWPVHVNQEGREVPVEGATRIRYAIFVNGDLVRRGTMSEAPDPFRVPVGIIRESNVRQVVSDALAYQFDKATTDLLDEFMWRVADAWPARP